MNRGTGFGDVHPQTWPGGPEGHGQGREREPADLLIRDVPGSGSADCAHLPCPGCALLGTLSATAALSGVEIHAGRRK